jgi:predicted  nucleic acid-binding Zn-ribbon protein
MLLNMDGLEDSTTHSGDAFAALEERILRAVERLKSERTARLAAEERCVALEAEIVGAAPRLEQMNHEVATLREEIAALRAERETVRERVERLLGQLDALQM